MSIFAFWVKHHYLFLCMVLVVVFLHAGQAYAVEADQIPNTPDVSQNQVKSTPVFVELEGIDTIGAKLSIQLQEIFNTGTLFTLTAQEQPKLRIVLRTVSEFSDRPNVGSVYSISWLYYVRETSFSSYLDAQIGVVGGDDVNSLALRLAEHTASIAARYAYIFDTKGEALKEKQ